MKKYFFIVLVCFFVKITKSQTQLKLIKIVADDRAENDCFGWATSIYNNYCVVGTPQKKAKAPIGNRLWQEGGGAYIFTKNTKGNWIQTQLLLPDKPKESDYFGTSVSMYDNYLAIGLDSNDYFYQINYYGVLTYLGIYFLNKEVLHLCRLFLIVIQLLIMLLLICISVK